MASTYSTNLAIELIGTGEQSGTWGTTTNTNLGTLLEQAISGYVTQAITDGADTTITIPNGATGVARNMAIEMTGALTATRNLIVPANKKLYFIFNNTSGGFAVTVKVTGLTGVSVPNGKKVILVSNGTDIVEAVNQVVGNLAVGGTLVASSTVTASGNTSTLSPPTRQVFLTGTSATYTTPSGCRRIVVRAKGAGGGGAGSGTTPPGAAAAGSATSFNSIGAAGGAAGGAGGGSGSNGGTGGSGSASVRIAGASGGQETTYFVSGTNGQYIGGMGGGQGGGHGSLGGATAGIANSGGGGGGAQLGSNTFANMAAYYGGAGGGEGEYIEIAITTPAATYTYTVGAAGVAGTAGPSGNNGGAGGSGYIIVDEYY